MNQDVCMEMLDHYQLLQCKFLVVQPNPSLPPIEYDTQYLLDDIGGSHFKNACYNIKH